MQNRFSKNTKFTLHYFSFDKDPYLFRQTMQKVSKKYLIFLVTNQITRIVFTFTAFIKEYIFDIYGRNIYSK